MGCVAMTIMSTAATETKAGKPIFYQTFSGSGNAMFGHMQVRMDIYVWTTQHIKCYVYYYVPDANGGIVFDAVCVDTSENGRDWDYGGNITLDAPNRDIPHYANGHWEKGYGENYGHLASGLWNSGIRPLFVVCGLKFKNAQMVYYIAQAFLIFNMNGRGIVILAVDELNVDNLLDTSGWAPPTYIGRTALI